MVIIVIVWQLHSSFIATHRACAGFLLTKRWEQFHTDIYELMDILLTLITAMEHKANSQKAIVIILLMIAISISIMYGTLRKQQKWHQSTLPLLHCYWKNHSTLLCLLHLIWLIHRLCVLLEMSKNRIRWVCMAMMQRFCNNYQLTVAISTVMYEEKGRHPSICIIWHIPDKLVTWMIHLQCRHMLL